MPDPDGAGSEVSAWTVYTYNSVGRKLTETDRLGHGTGYDYDNLGRLTKKTDAEGGETDYTYDANGNRLTLTDPEENTTTWTYDALNRMLTNTNELSDTRSYEYDAAGNLVEYTDRNGRVTVYEYDDLQRRTAEKWMDGVTVVRTLSYAYDAASQLTSASDPEATYTFSYDNLGRNIGVTHDLADLGFDVIISEEYDALGRRTSLAAEIDGTDDLINTYAYDYLSRMTQVTQGSQSGGNVVAEKRVDFAYDAEDKGQFTAITRYADLAGTELVATSTYGYDNSDRITSLDHDDSSSSTLAGYTWSYDQGNRLTAFTVYGYSAEDATYSYDDTDQLTGADRSGTSEDESYTYDENGNRTNTGYSTGDNNQLLSDGTYNYTYDDEGNRLTKTNISTGEVIEYTWDYRNRLVNITTKDNLDVVTHEVDYTYDIFNRRIVKSIDADGAGSGTATEEIFIYDGLREERGAAGDHMLLRFDEADDLTDRFMYGSNVDQVLASEEVTSTSSVGDVLWALTDHLGTVRDIAEYDSSTDTTTTVNHLAYNAFGDITSETNSAVDFLFGFTSRERDEESDLQYNRARYFEAGVGRWISEDPIGFSAGDDNLYRYAGNDTASRTDPSGNVDARISISFTAPKTEEDIKTKQYTGSYFDLLFNYESPFDVGEKNYLGVTYPSEGKWKITYDIPISDECGFIVLAGDITVKLHMTIEAQVIDWKDHRRELQQIFNEIQKEAREHEMTHVMHHRQILSQLNLENKNETFRLPEAKPLPYSTPEEREKRIKDLRYYAKQYAERATKNAIDSLWDSYVEQYEQASIMFHASPEGQPINVAEKFAGHIPGQK